MARSDSPLATTLAEVLGADERIASRIVEGVQTERVATRRAIIHAGETSLALVTRGAVKLVTERVLFDVARGPCLVGSADAPDPWDVVALRPCIIARLEPARLQSYAALELARLAAERSRSLAERIACRAAGTVEQRLERLLADLSRRYGEKVGGGHFVALPLRRRELASLVGATTETVSRIFAEWRRGGVVRASRDGIWWATLPA